MKAVLDLLCIREASGRNLSHPCIESAGDGLDRLSYGPRAPAQRLAANLGLGALDQGDQGPVFTVAGFVREGRGKARLG